MKDIKNIIVVSSGKGGVGKSTVSVNLAVTLAKKNYTVGLLDADIYGPSIPTMCGEHKKPKVSEEKKIIPFNKFGIKFMSIGNLIPENKPMIWRGTMVVNALNQLLKDIYWGELDFLIIDLPPGTGDVQLSLSQTLPLKGAVVVSTPQKISLIDVRRAINMFKRVNVNILGLIENMSYLLNQKGDEKIYLFGKNGVKNEAKKEKINLLGEIPIIQSIALSSDNGSPETYNESTNTFKIFSKIADKMIEELDKSLGKEVTIEIED